MVALTRASFCNRLRNFGQFRECKLTAARISLWSRGGRNDVVRRTTCSGMIDSLGNKGVNA